MNPERIQSELIKWSLKNRLIKTLKDYIYGMRDTRYEFLLQILRLLEEKYPNEEDVQFIDNGIRKILYQINMHNVETKIFELSSHLYGYENVNLMNDLLLSIRCE